MGISNINPYLPVGAAQAGTLVLAVLAVGCTLGRPAGFPAPYWVPPAADSVQYPTPYGWTATDRGNGQLEIRGTWSVPDISASKEYDAVRRGRELWLIAVSGRTNSGIILTAGWVHHRGWFYDLPPGVYRLHIWQEYTNPADVDHKIVHVFDQKVTLK